MAWLIRRRLLMLCVFVLFTSLWIFAQPHYRIISFDKLNDRVTQVNRIVRDGQGMMWFATNDGMYRYDGYEFKNFKSRSGDGINMPSNRISYMYPSSEGGVWCIAAHRTFLFDTHTYRFIDVLGDYERAHNLSLKVYRIRPLPCGVTWIFTEDKKLFALEDARPTTSVRLMAENEAIDNFTVVCDAQQRSWVLTQKNTYLYDNKELLHFDQHFQQIIISGKAVWLVGPDGKSLSVFDEATRKLKPWTHPLLTSAIDGYSLLSNGSVVLSTASGLLLLSADGKNLSLTDVKTPSYKVMEDGNGHLWVHTQDGRLLLTDSICRQSVEVAHLQGKKSNLMRDKNGNVWIFTNEGDAYYSHADNPTDIIKYVREEFKGEIANTINDGQGGYWFIHKRNAYRLTFDSPNFRYLPLFQPDQVRCIVKDSRERVFVGCRYDESVTVFSKTGQRLGWLTRDGRISSSHVSFGASIYSGWCADDGTLWLGSKMHGLFRLRPQQDGTYQISNYVKDAKNPKASISDNEIYAFAPDNKGRLWLATRKGGLCCVPDYKAETPQFIHSGNGLPGWKTSIDTGGTSLLLTPSGLLLVGAQDGLYIGDINTSDLSKITFKIHQREAGRKESLSSSNITDIIRVSDGRIFLSTGDGGVNEILSKDLSADRLNFRHYNLATGFPADIIHNFVEYDQALWSTAPNQLIELQLKQTETPDINLFLLRESPRFSSCRPVHIDKGKWLFGSDDGALLIDLDQLKSSSFVPPLVVTGVSKENQPVDYATAWNDTIVLSPKERDLTIWFSALDFEDTELVAYAYRLGDEDRPWTYIGQNHSVTFSQMRPGTYHLVVRSTNSNGVWCDNEGSLTIIVKPGFWETPWAILLIILITALVVGGVIYTLLYIRRIQRQQHETMEAYLALLSEKRSAAEPASSQPVETTPMPQTPTIMSEDDEKLMERLTHYIDEHLSDSDITIDDMASAVAVSRSGLHRKVKHMLGASPMEFLREARIRRASQMLIETNKPVTQVAYECGFADPKYFSKCFKASTGKTPTEFKASL